jgi:acyl-coenzyme A thioesterase PaaI-like protein
MNEADVIALFKGMPPPPSATHLGARFLEVDVKTGRVVIEFEARPEFVNPAGVVQGGFLAARPSPRPST